MKDLLIYIFQVSLLLLCSYATYKIIFSRDTFHHIKRFVLLFMVLISFVLPICKITIHKEVVIENKTSEAVITNVSPLDEWIGINLPVTEERTSSDWLFIVGIFYFVGVVILFIYRLFGIWRVRLLMKKATNKYIYKGVEVLLIADNIPVFSFGNKIVMSQKDYDENVDMIIRHELVHIKQYHSIDLLFINIALSFQWFNPFMWFLVQELVLNHEFCADKGVIQNGIDAKKYQYLLISKYAGSNDLIPVVNHFRSNDLHKRIKIMKRKSSKWAQLKLFMVIPLVSVMLVAFAEIKYDVKQKGVMPEKEQFQDSEQFHMPYQGQIRRTYGKQIHPITKKEHMHIGVDIVVTNDTIRAPYSGVVKYADHPTDGYGNKLVISHNDGLETTYAHLEKFLTKEGVVVKGGEPIAIVGNTGLSTGKHLHLECRINNKIVDPELILPLNKE